MANQKRLFMPRMRASWYTHNAMRRNATYRPRRKSQNPTAEPDAVAWNGVAISPRTTGISLTLRRGLYRAAFPQAIFISLCANSSNRQEGTRLAELTTGALLLVIGVALSVIGILFFPFLCIGIPLLIVGVIHAARCRREEFRGIGFLQENPRRSLASHPIVRRALGRGNRDDPEYGGVEVRPGRADDRERGRHDADPPRDRGELPGQRARLLGPDGD